MVRAMTLLALAASLGTGIFLTAVRPAVGRTADQQMHFVEGGSIRFTVTAISIL